MSRRTIDVQDGDYEFIDETKESLELLFGMIEEMFNEHKGLLLSPVMRRLLLEKSIECSNRFNTIKMGLCVDNLIEPLQKTYEDRNRKTA